MKKFLPIAAAVFACWLPLPGGPVNARAEMETSEADTGKSSDEIVTRPRLRPIPFKSVVSSVDSEGRNFRMGKKKLRLVLITPETRFLFIDGRPATVKDLYAGAEIRGSTRKRESGELEAVTVKIGAKRLNAELYPEGKPTRGEEAGED